MKMKPNRMFRRKEVRNLRKYIVNLEAKYKLLTDMNNDLIGWAEYINLKMSEIKMIKDALENRIFRGGIYGLKARWGIRKTYVELLEKIKKDLKRRDMI